MRSRLTIIVLNECFQIILKNITRAFSNVGNIVRVKLKQQKNQIDHMIALTNCKLLYGGGFSADKVVLIQEGIITGIQDEIHEKAKKIDCVGNFVTPGLVDLQIYGAGGYLFSNDTNKVALKTIADAIVAGGTTSFLITLATNTIDVFKEAIRVVKQNPHPALMGIHFEGPYINPIKRGAHLLHCIKKPTLSEIQSLLDEAEGVIKMITLAPELTAPDIIELLLKNNVVVSAGHSNATFLEAMKGFERGIRTATHLFNAMSPLHHRDTGLPGAIFQSNACAGIIADGIHVDYQTLSISKKIMNERLFLITDAVEEVLEGPYVHVRGADKFTLPDGTLSGSQLTLLQAVKNCVQKVGIPLDEAIRMATLYPSRVMQEDNIGAIEIGRKADLILFDEDLKLKRVYLGGVNKLDIPDKND